MDLRLATLKQSLSICCTMFQHWINAERFSVSHLCVNTLPARVWGFYNGMSLNNNHCTLMTNLMHWLLFIHKILFSSKRFEPQVLIFRRIQLYTCSIWYCHSLQQFVVACRYTARVRIETVLTQAVYQQATTNSRREWQYHMLHVYNCILLNMSTWGSKHVEEYNILWINYNQYIKLVINI